MGEYRSVQRNVNALTTVSPLLNEGRVYVNRTQTWPSKITRQPMRGRPDLASRPLSADQVADYVADYDSKCPYCGSDEIEGGRLQSDAGAAWADVTCNACGETWQTPDTSAERNILLFTNHEPKRKEKDVAHCDVSDQGSRPSRRL
jgi:hypothetical protein